MSSPFQAFNHLIRVTPSALGELTGAVHLLQREGAVHAEAHPWQQQFVAERPDLVDELRSWWPDTAKIVPRGLELLWLGVHTGHLAGEDLETFFARFDELLSALLEDKQDAIETSDPRPEFSDALMHRLTSLQHPELQKQYVAFFRRLWGELFPMWERDGLPVVRLECARLQQRLDDGANLLELLPPKHFVQFDEYASIVKAALEARRSVIVTPLHFAGGGYLMDFETETTPVLVGYGSRFEGVHSALAQKAADIALRLKALSDPTRLGLLATLQELEVTVGDMAKLLDVRQPTVSGHLKVLKSAGLVTVRKKGVKSFYRADADAVESLLADARDLLL